MICQLPVKVGPFNLNLVDFQISSSSNSEDSANGGQSGHRSKGVKVIDPRNLKKSLCDKLHFVSNDITGHILFGLEDPFGSNDIGAEWGIDQFPCSGFTQHFRVPLPLLPSTAPSLLDSWPPSNY
jgi:hypothetical protein